MRALEWFWISLVLFTVLICFGTAHAECKKQCPYVNGVMVCPEDKVIICTGWE